MHIKLENWLDFFVFFIILVKIVFVISAIGTVVLSHSTSAKAEKIDPKLLYWKERTEFVFTICMAILLVYHFNPCFTKKPIDEETSTLFFLFGLILIITAKWSLFIHEASWYTKIANMLK